MTRRHNMQLMIEDVLESGTAETIGRRSVPVSFETLIESRSVSRVQWTAIALVVLCSVFDGFDMQSFGFLVPAIARSMHHPLVDMTWAIMAGLIGLAIGAIFLGRLSDRIGRRPVLIGSFLVAGGATMATAASADLVQLSAIRLLAGVGLGGAVPVLTAMVAELFPRRLRAILICATCAAVPLGGLFASLVGAQILPLYGWRGVLIAGGVLPLIIIPFLWLLLPESPAIVAARGDRAGVQRLLRSIWPGHGADVEIAAPGRQARASLKKLFAAGLGAPTALLWAVVFMNLLSLYFFVNWLPALLAVARLPERVGVYAVGAFSFGGIVGQLAQGPIIARFGMLRVLPVEFAVVLVSIVALAMVPITPASVLGIVTILSIALQAGQAGVIALAATFYPATLRTTGLGAMMALGRLGSILGPFIGGFGLKAGLTPQHILLLVTVPTAISLAGILLLGRVIGFQNVERKA